MQFSNNLQRLGKKDSWELFAKFNKQLTKIEMVDAKLQMEELFILILLVWMRIPKTDHSEAKAKILIVMDRNNDKTISGSLFQKVSLSRFSWVFTILALL